MKQAKSALLYCLTTIVLVGAFVFGRVVYFSSRTPLREAKALASEQARRNQWTVEALGASGSHSITVQDSPPPTQMAANDSSSGDDSDNSIYSSNSPLVTFESVYELLKEQYVDKIPSDTPLAHGAVSAMIASLDDPNSRFLDHTELSAIDDQDKGIFAGTGIAFSVRKVTVGGLLERQLTVIDAIAGSPAQKAGIKTGDIVTDINGQWVVSFDPFQQQAKLFKTLSSDPVSFNHQVDATEAKIKNGLTLPAAQELLDTIQPQPLVLSITRGANQLKLTVDGSQTTVVTDVVSKTLADGNGYIQVNAFTDSTSKDFVTAFQSVSSAPGIVIDLRACPGGSLDPALAIANALAPNQPFGSIVIRDNRAKSDKSLGFGVRTEPIAYADTTNSTPPLSYSGHIVVLVNEGTANTAELFAAFLHDRLGARIIGSSTFGDGLAQTLFPMRDGSGFTLTTGLVKTSNNLAFAGKGLTPDEALAASDADSDAALQHAETALTLKPLSTSSAALTVGGQKS